MEQLVKIPKLTNTLATKKMQELETIKSNLQKFNSDILKEAIKYLESQINLLKQNISSSTLMFHSIIRRQQKNGIYYQRIYSQMKSLQKKISIKKTQISKGIEDREFKEEIQNLHAKYIEISRDRVTAANAINLTNLKNIKIFDRSSSANNLFKWILVIIFKNPVSLYYWSNFKQTIIGKDGGRDFIEKLGKVLAIQATYQQMIMTQALLSQFDQLYDCQQFQKFHENLDRFRIILKSFKACYQIGGILNKIDEKIGDAKALYEVKCKECNQYQKVLRGWQDRLDAVDKYSEALKITKDKLNKNIDLYQQKIDEIIKMKKELQSYSRMSTGLDDPKQKNQSQGVFGQSIECSIF